MNLQPLDIEKIETIIKQQQDEIELYHGDINELVKQMILNRYQAKIEAEIILQHFLNSEESSKFPYNFDAKGPSENAELSVFEEYALKLVNSQYLETQKQHSSGRYTIGYDNEKLAFIDKAGFWEYPGQWYYSPLRLTNYEFLAVLMQELILRTKSNNTNPFESRNYDI